MSAPRPSSLVAIVKSSAVLASPVRIELIGALQTHGPSSIGELAAHMSRPADGLYHHVRLLLQAGVIRQTEERKAGRHREAIYGLIAPRIGAAIDPASEVGRQAAVRAAQAALRMAAREFTTALLDCSTLETGKKFSGLRASRQKVWLTERALAQLQKSLQRIERFLNRENKRRRGQLHVLTTVLSPVVKRTRR
jgi:hypothetical protein